MVLALDVRERFAALRLPSAANGLAGQQPLLREEELAAEPLKWLKYLVLARTGLESLKTIEEQVKRFDLSQVDEAVQWTTDRLAGRGRDHMVVIKVVPWHRGAQLANCRVSDVEEVPAAFARIREQNEGLRHELWCCDSSVDTSGFNLGGRLTVPGPDGEQVLEMVWYASPRLIESVTLPDFDRPYIRAVRTRPTCTFDVQVIHVPSAYRRVTSPEGVPDDGPWRGDFRAVARELHERREAIGRLAQCLREIGAQEACLCFKVSDGRLTVIDWDTEIESSAR